jgi:hypothetical protein
MGFQTQEGFYETGQPSVDNDGGYDILNYMARNAGSYKDSFEAFDSEDDSEGYGIMTPPEEEINDDF